MAAVTSMNGAASGHQWANVKQIADGWVSFIGLTFDNTLICNFPSNLLSPSKQLPTGLQ
jgi:hypothetical protein